MKSIKNVPLRTPRGAMDWQQFEAWFDRFKREEMREMDMRDPNQGVLSGRTVTLPTLEGLIADDGRALNQRFMHPLYSANRNSVQSADDIITAASGSGPLSAQIDIAAHSVKFDFGTVPYNAGTVSGLNPETFYYLYADDPEFEGGAVVYGATDEPNDLIVKGRYYVGNIETPISGNSRNVVDATATNPIVFETSIAHGWSSGQTVTFAALPGDFGSNLNGNFYTITVIDPDHFSIAVDGTLYVAYTSGGTATRSTTSVQSGGGAGAGVGGNRFDFR